MMIEKKFYPENMTTEQMVEQLRKMFAEINFGQRVTKSIDAYDFPFPQKEDFTVNLDTGEIVKYECDAEGHNAANLYPSCGSIEFLTLKYW